MACYFRPRGSNIFFSNDSVFVGVANWTGRVNNYFNLFIKPSSNVEGTGSKKKKKKKEIIEHASSACLYKKKKKMNRADQKY